MESIIQKKLFNKDECDYFKSLSSDKSFKRSKVTGYNNIDIISKHRTSSELIIELNHDLSNILLPKFKEFGIKSLPDFFIILKYDVNQEFKKHTDSGVEYPNRYKTLIQVSSNWQEGAGEKRDDHPGPKGCYDMYKIIHKLLGVEEPFVDFKIEDKELI